MMGAKARPTAKEIFTAFKLLPKAERDAVLVGIARDRALRRDLLDLATFAERQRESSRPLRDYLAKPYR
jgi:hypothetical protein